VSSEKTQENLRTMQTTSCDDIATLLAQEKRPEPMFSSMYFPFEIRGKANFPVKLL
jgi:hypothetical protein